jgi:hypothetical protein
MALSRREQIASVLRRAGLQDAAADALVTLPENPSDEEVEQFCIAHGLSAETVMNLMGSSP